MSTGPAVTVGEINRFLADEMPFCAEMGITCEHVALDVGVTRFSYEPRWTRPGGIINGGTLMALADVALYIAIFTRTGIVGLTVTNELKMNFLRPAIGADVVARARLRKLGRRVAYGDVELATTTDPERLVAHATSSYVRAD